MSNKITTIGVIGSGAWGITLAKVLCQNSYRVILWCHNEQIEEEQNKNDYLKEFLAAKTLVTTTELTKAVEGSEALLLVVASHFYRLIAADLKPLIKPDQLIISATKGLEELSHQRMSEIAFKELGKNIADRYVVISGPNLSAEILNDQPAAAVAAGKNKENAELVQELFNSSLFRVYTSNDIVGVELGGTLKNVIAIAAGIADGLQYGNNAKSALMIRGIYEMSRLALALGAKPQTLLGLSGMGDLITTCSSKLSRNHQVGEKLAEGQNLQEILKNMKAVAEGIKTTKAVWQLAQEHKIEMPITEQIYQVLYNNKAPKLAISDLMNRKPKSEIQEW
jgi:glycerol-3-phosphate dehydrogenase (NAD(P)+)